MVLASDNLTYYLPTPQLTTREQPFYTKHLPASYICRPYNKAVKESTPYEDIHGNKPSIHYLQTFGRKCFFHIPEEKRPSSSKLLPHAVEGRFIGYSTSNRIKNNEKQ
jgi:hypothetical protein